MDQGTRHTLTVTSRESAGITFVKVQGSLSATTAEQGLTRLGMASRRRTATLPGVRARSIQDHQAIVEALSRRDPEAAADIMRQHLEIVESSLHEALA